MQRICKVIPSNKKCELGANKNTEKHVQLCEKAKTCPHFSHRCIYVCVFISIKEKKNICVCVYVCI